ncbi:MAG TPA: Mut7-C RNAse domain-containing protein [Spirochaetota bacterium]|nr:Mut7-C RNAse domain-containing protein [Spirochaetota bacterium]HPI88902.1 Mut7-C RNAse domain-containing protein [Spirochaetota bacterium]HPR46968.1 Mut7-C RNAse domain-containing protein [Spirochaetota bacterium]
MYRVTVRFYEELNDFLPAGMRKKDIPCAFNGRRSVKDLIESLGVPHVEVDLVLVNGESVGFSRIVADRDRISVYPVFESFDIRDVTRLRPSPLREPSFVLDVHLRKLARRLRLLGFDVDYEDGRDDAELARISSRSKRILLTRDRQLLMRSIVERGLYVRNTDPLRQVIEVLDRLDLWSRCAPFARCIECNGAIQRPKPEDVDRWKGSGVIPPGVALWCDDYTFCPECGRVYWKGTHYEKLRRIAGEILSKAPDCNDRR